MALATIYIWSEPEDSRSCQALVYENCCVLELRSQGQRVLVAACQTVSEALQLASQWHPSGMTDCHEAA